MVASAVSAVGTSQPTTPPPLTRTLIGRLFTGSSKSNPTMRSPSKSRASVPICQLTTWPRLPLASNRIAPHSVVKVSATYDEKALRPTVCEIFSSALAPAWEQSGPGSSLSQLASSRIVANSRACGSRVVCRMIVILRSGGGGGMMQALTKTSCEMHHLWLLLVQHGGSTGCCGSSRGSCRCLWLNGQEPADC